MAITATFTCSKHPDYDGTTNPGQCIACQDINMAVVKKDDFKFPDGSQLLVELK